MFKGRIEDAKKWCRTNLYHQDFHIEKVLLQDDTRIIKVHFRRPEDAMIFKIAFCG